jgi:hypothetical protein
MTGNSVGGSFWRHPVWATVIGGVILLALSFMGHLVWSVLSPYISSPSVSIRSPLPLTREPNNGFGANGLIYHKPSGMDLWLVVESGIEHRYYPFNSLAVQDNEWRVPTSEICTASGWQIIQLYLVPNTADAILFTYSQDNTPNFTGLATMPAGSVWEKQSRIYVVGTVC